jgi:hypothetical protein
MSKLVKLSKNFGTRMPPEALVLARGDEQGMTEYGLELF